MPAQFDSRHRGQLATWANRTSPKRTRRSDTAAEDRHMLRFAFYGRTSTEDYQDRASSQCWQREAAENVIAGRGVIVAEFFDSGYSRRLPWPARPQTAALLEAVRDPARGFDAIVVGEFERAFYGHQLQQLLPMLDRYGVQVWLPESDGPIDVTSPTHQALMLLLGAQSRREVMRSRHRVLAAMRAQVCEQGRYLGGRPPYGYRLVDAGPHPNQAHAQWGRRLRRLDPEPVTARHVRWMFAQRLVGCSVARIARELNDRGVPCPSHVDPGRNSHRSGAAWTLRTVAAILANPRYTGRQVWNRQARNHDTQPADKKRRRPAHRWNPVQDWVISEKVVHPPLVAEHDFVAVQAIRAARPTADGDARTYVLAGLLQCGECGRRMDAHWVHGRPGYRCRHGHTSSRSPNTRRTKSLYVREDHVLASLPAHVVDLHLEPSEISAPTTDPDQAIVTLRANNLVIICSEDGRTLLAATPDPEHAMTP